MKTADEILQRLELFGVRLGLGTTRALLSELGCPEADLSVVLVAGTNGKGSTAALLAAICSTAGYRTGLYTSPHLESVEERIRIDGRAIAPERLGDVLERVVAAGEKANGAPPTYFEALTAAALLHCAEEKVELAVLEVGMGGRLDATNVADPTLSIITPIGLDHTRHLGETLTAIAREKAGVMRPGKVTFAEPGSEEAAATLLEVAAEKRTDLRLAGDEARIELEGSAMPLRQRFALETDKGRYRFDTALAGEHQTTNIRLAVLAAEELAAQGRERIDREVIERAVERCRWPGRLEEVPLPDGRRILLDGGHNPAGVRALLAVLDRLDEPFDLLFATFADKQASEMVPGLARRARRVTLTTVEGRKPWPVAELAELVDDATPTILEPSTGAALDAALSQLGTGRRLVVTGSLYLVGEVRRRLRLRFGLPSPATDPLY